MVRQSPRKTQKGPALQATTEAKVNGKAQKHASRAVAEEAQAPARQSKGASSNKRKSARAEEENDSYAEEENDKYSESSENERSESPPAKKKAKTAGRARTTKANANANSNASDNMILAERVSPTSLKKAMYIGAHISAAGGMHISQSLP